MRRCVYCGQEKEDEFFIHDKYAKDGIRNVCLECNKKRAKMRRAISKKHLEELEKKLNDYIQIKSISVDISTEESPDNRIYAKPIEKQGDVLLCEFETANYDIEQKALKEENTKLKELLKECELWFTGVVGNMNDKNVGEHNRNLPIGNFEHIFKVFSQKIDKVLGEE